MFHRRPDATLVSDAAPMRRIMPYVSPRRNDSTFYLPQEMEVEAALEFLEKRNPERPPDRPITLFHLLLRSCSQALVLRPGVNRFVKGGRLWQRDGAYITFSAKRAIVDGAPMLTIKRRFAAERESLDEMVDAVYDTLRPARAGVASTSDKETRLLLRLPGVVTGAAIRAANALDTLGLLPRSMIEPDPLFTSLFVANLGSVGHDAGFHHLWERGTCSLFCVMGRIRRRPDGRRVMTVCWTYDERVEDGLYSYITIDGIQERIEHPEQLLATTGELARRDARADDARKGTEAP
ncbi:MAG TPA: hypothetical protein VIY27_08970 [Myxococcota bacterium]